MATADELTDDLADDDERWEGIRAAVKAARELDEEPPARLDVLLMAAARQHAPAPRRGVFERLRRWMAVAMLQPAVAGATALAVIGGTAGVLYLRNHGELAQPTVSRTAPAGTPAEAPVAGWSGSGAGAGSGSAPARPAVTVFPDVGGDRVTTEGRPVVPGDLQDLDRHQERERVDVPRPRGAPGGGSGSATAGSGGGRNFEARDPIPTGGGGDEGGGGATDDDARATTGMVGGVVTKMPLTLESPPPPTDPVEDKPTTDGWTTGNERRGGSTGGGATVTTDKIAIADEQGPAKGETQAVANQRQAENLLRQARSAARKKNCATVKVMAKRAKALDPAYYTSTFARDAAVKPCL